MSVRIYGGEAAHGEAVFRLEPSPDDTWREIFEDGLEETLDGRVRIEGDRLIVRATSGMVHEGRLNGSWTHALELRVRATYAEWKLRRDWPPSR